MSPVASVAPAVCPAVSVFTAFFLALQRDRDHAPTWPGNDVFDFIVVGAGSAGCVVASRLSEVAEWRVLLLEAGPPEPPEAQVPATYRNLQLTALNWRYHSEPDRGYCNNTGCPCPKGKVIGGTSTLNGFVYIRGSPRDYDDWANILADEGWSYAGVLPFFLRSENILEDDLAQDAAHHAKGGPLPVQRLPDQDPVNEHLRRAMRDIGLEANDPNGASQIGYSMAQTTTANGERASAGRAFLATARDRPNLVVRTGALVTRVLFQGGKAVGVEYRVGDSVDTARASREVVLSAGVMNSPQILMLSGVGPKDQLTSFGIDVVSDLPAVGENLMNHVTSLGVEYLLPEGWQGPPAIVTKRIADFINFVPGGPLSSVGPEEITAFYKFPETEGSANDDVRPDINLRFYGVVPKSVVGVAGCVVAPAHDPLFYDRLLVTPVVLPTRSVGTVRLREPDPHAAPRITLNLLGDEDGNDLGLLVRGLKKAAALGDTASFRDAGLVLNKQPLPGCEQHPFAGDAYWECVARTYTVNTYHTAGTCRMAAVDGVLDPQMRVRGVSRLRVIDASAMPLLPRGNPNAPVIMMAEKGAHLIRQAWQRSSDTRNRLCPRGPSLSKAEAVLREETIHFPSIA